MQLPVRSQTAPTMPLDFTPLGPRQRCRILFVYPNVYMHMPHLGLATLSACARAIGAEPSLCDLTGVPPSLVEDVVQSRVRRIKPDLVAFTATSDQWPLIRSTVAACRKLGLPHIVGGPHPTSDPDGVITEADALVVGEGEGALMDIIRASADERPLNGIANTWVRNAAGAIVRTSRRRLIEDLDVLPFPDWSLFDTLHYRVPFRSWTAGELAERPVWRATIEASRGCPYQCTYCCNTGYMNAYRGLGKWRREKSVDRVLAELKHFRKTCGGLDRVVWVDEVFATGRQRMADFARRYPREIGVPFNIQERPENLTAQKITLLAQAGLDEIAIGFESGDETIRKSVLNRRTTDDVLTRAFDVPRALGVRTLAFTMVGVPGQDRASLRQSWRMLRRLRPHAARVSIFRPMKGTPLYDDCVRRGMYDPQHDTDTFESGPLVVHDHLSNDMICRYQRLLSELATIPGIWPDVVFAFARHSSRATRAILAGRQAWSVAHRSILRRLTDTLTAACRACKGAAASAMIEADHPEWTGALRDRARDAC